MKQLFLLRHGEAEFSGGADFLRQLTQKGKENLLKMGLTISDKEIVIDQMYCSSASRAKETAETIKNFIQVKEGIFMKEIYDANLEFLLNLIESTPKNMETCLIIGHNPTISALLSYLVNENYINMQPGMLAHVEFEFNDWLMVGLGSGTLREIIR
jgi:phosphohistidine phosphatase